MLRWWGEGEGGEGEGGEWEGGEGRGREGRGREGREYCKIISLLAELIM